MQNRTITYREGTTRYVDITCVNAEKAPFDFTGWTVTTCLVTDRPVYLPTAIVGNMLSFKLPAAASLGRRRLTTVTRIFRDDDDDVASVIEINYDIEKSAKPDIVPGNILPEES